MHMSLSIPILLFKPKPKSPSKIFLVLAQPLHLKKDRQRKAMDSEAVINKDMKVEVPSHEAAEVISPVSSGGLARQGSITKHNCLCSPTTHPGSFRCRLHRTPSLQRTKSIDSHDSQSKVANNAVNAQ
ncbi:hypothetical protein Sango_1074200 [Sesamum angolense]|uniref:Uncharacterized protein n=1 Tax=Sesamum angolense TaxID=2727404 RepID=A0AAE2BVT7_9LAMI|nr:hypothetical protein Sango_1074200 [Sesamum angolense]